MTGVPPWLRWLRKPPYGSIHHYQLFWCELHGYNWVQDFDSPYLCRLIQTMIWTILSSLGCAKTAAHPFSKPTCKWGSPIGLWTTLSYLHSQIAYTESIKPKKHQSIKQHKHTHTTKSGCWFSLITQKKKSIEDRHSSYGLNIKPSTKKSINWLERSIIYERAVARYKTPSKSIRKINAWNPLLTTESGWLKTCQTKTFPPSQISVVQPCNATVKVTVSGPVNGPWARASEVDVDLGRFGHGGARSQQKSNFANGNNKPLTFIAK